MLQRKLRRSAAEACRRGGDGDARRQVGPFVPGARAWGRNGSQLVNGSSQRDALPWALTPRRYRSPAACAAAPSLLPLSSIVFLFFSEIMASDFGGFSELIYLFEMVLQMI